MPQVINTNVMSLNAQRNLNTSQTAMASAVQRLSSGLRVNSAKDDAAGLAIAERMNAQVRGMNVAMRNAADGISLAQTADGALGVISNNLQRMRELSVQAANATASNDVTSLAAEFNQLKAENTRLISATKFNGTGVLNGSATLTFQVGANSSDTIDVDTSNLSLTAAVFTDGDSARTAMDALDDDLDTVNGLRATFGAVQSRFETVISGLQITAENTAAARGRIVDADYAAETAALTRAQILQQAGVAMLAQANAAPQSVLTLLRG